MLSFIAIKILLLTTLYLSLCFCWWHIRALARRRGGAREDLELRLATLLGSGEELKILEAFAILRGRENLPFEAIPPIRAACEGLLDHPSATVSIEAGNLLAHIGDEDTVGLFIRHLERLSLGTH